jgi:hypothetical protein
MAVYCIPKIYSINHNHYFNKLNADSQFLATKREFFVSTVSRTTLGLTQPLYNGYFGESGRDMKLTTHIDLVPSSRMVKLYLHSPYASTA